MSHFLTSSQIQPVLSQTEFALFQKVLTARSGIDINEDRKKSLTYAVNKRKKAIGLETAAEYYQFLMQEGPYKTELHNLINEITIKETYFYRHPLHFDVLKKDVLPELISRKTASGQTIRIWSAGCSTGEETYTLAMACYELGLSKREHCEIVGSDIDNQAIAQARKAVYSNRSIRVRHEELQPYIVPVSKDSFCLQDEIRRIPRFFVHNLLNTDNSPFLRNPLDIIFCRNVLIYFQDELIDRLLDFFFRILEPRGVLFLGGTETLNLYEHRFADVLLHNTFYYRKERGIRTTGKMFAIKAPISPEPVKVESPVDKWAPVEEMTGPIETDLVSVTASGTSTALIEQTPEGSGQDRFAQILTQATQALVQENFQESKAILETILAVDPNNLNAQILLSEVVMNLGDYPSTIAYCMNIQKIDPLNPDVYYILGCILKKEKDDQAALDYFRRAMYLNPDLAMAHFSLANIFRDQADLKNARRSYVNAIKALKKYGEDDIIKFASGFRRYILIRTCERNIGQIDALEPGLSIGENK